MTALTNTEEAVLVAVDALTIDRVPAEPGKVWLQSAIAMTKAETIRTAGGLAMLALLTVVSDDGRPYYVLTPEGQECLRAIYAKENP